MKYKTLFELACFELAINAQCPEDRPDYCPYRQEKEYPEIIEAEMDICIKCWDEHFKKELKEQEEIKRKINPEKSQKKVDLGKRTW